MKRLTMRVCAPLALSTSMLLSGCGQTPHEPTAESNDPPRLMEAVDGAIPLRGSRYPRPTTASIQPVAVSFGPPPLPQQSTATASPPPAGRAAEPTWGYQSEYRAAATNPSPASPDLPLDAASGAGASERPSARRELTRLPEVGAPARVEPVREDPLNAGSPRHATDRPVLLPPVVATERESVRPAMPHMTDAMPTRVEGVPNERSRWQQPPPVDEPSFVDGPIAADPSRGGAFSRLPESPTSSPQSGPVFHVPPFAGQPARVSPTVAAPVVANGLNVQPQPQMDGPTLSGALPPGIQTAVPGRTAEDSGWRPSEASPGSVATDGRQSSDVPQLALVDRSAMDAVAARAEQLTNRGVQLARRGAHHSAEADLIDAVRTLAQALDAAHGSRDHIQSLRRALRAMDEASEFVGLRSSRGDWDGLTHLINGHRTPVLKDQPLDDVTPIKAVQQYYAYAQQQLALASGREPSASLALYALGRLHGEIARQTPDRQAVHNPRAMAYYQSALLVDPRNHLAANELGVTLARFGQLADARTALRHSVSVVPTAEAWHNLAVVHQKMGEVELAALARSEYQLAQRSGVPGGATDVEWVLPAEFSAPAPNDQPAAAAPAGDWRQATRDPAPQSSSGSWWMPWKPTRR